MSTIQWRKSFSKTENIISNFIKMPLLPPGNEVWGKVMFSQASVCPQGRSLSRGFLVWGVFVNEVSVWGGGLCPGVLWPGWGFCQGEVSVQGHLCPGGPLSGGLCPEGGSLSRGVSVHRGSLSGRPPRAVKSGQHVSYWNESLCNDSWLEISFVIEWWCTYTIRHRKRDRHRYKWLV